MMRTTVLRTLALGAGIALLATACSSGDAGDDSTDGASGDTTITWWHNSNTGEGKDYYDKVAQTMGAGAVNEAGLDFYSRLVDGLLKRGIQPYATLYHWDLPAALQRADGGWANRDTAYRFADYATVVTQRLGDRIRSFATHNEPWVTATIGHELGHFAPGVKSLKVAAQVSHHCLLSHGLAMQAMRDLTKWSPMAITIALMNCMRH